jgi:NADH-quinone oxidoreductase subunit C
LSSVDEEAPAPEAPAERDELREEQLDGFRRELGDAVVEHHIRPGDDLWVRIASDAWAATADAARRKLGYGYFCFLSALDWLPAPFGRYEDAEVDTPLADRLARTAEIDRGYTGGDTRFQVLARLVNVRRHAAVTLKVDVPDDSLTIDSWSPVYAGADWHERETWEMYGITFRGHPNLIHIYLPGDFEGFPLRKDFPLLARVVKPWPGIVDVEPMPAGEEEEAEEGTDEDATTEGADEGAEA